MSNILSLKYYFNQLPINIVSLVFKQVRSLSNITKRHTGYINKFPANSDGLIGFIVKDDEPNKEYIFHIDDIHYEDIQLVRQYQTIEFDIFDGIPYKKAKNITAPSMQLLKNLHRNSLLKHPERTKRLSEFETTDNIQRYKGIVHSVNLEKKEGFITPDQLYCDLLHFNFSEIQSTGIAQLQQNDYISFQVKHGYPFDIAYCIKRADDGLITFEDYKVGDRRRFLGEIYNENDEIAKDIPDEYIVNNRHCGYIIHVNEERLLGYILSFENKDLISIHVDDCHMFGNRKLRRFQQVEFSVAKMEDNKLKAIHITAPDLSLLYYNYDNHYLSNDLKTKRYSQQMHQERYQGVITNILKNNRYEITPNLYGYKTIIGDGVEFRAVGNKSLKIGDAIEYHIDYQTQKPFHITAHGGYPFVCEYSNSEYSQYLRNKLGLTTFRKHFMSYDDQSNNDSLGFIASFNEQTHVGTIEIISKNNDIRYKQILFHLKDSDDFPKQPNFIKNQKIRFEFEKMNTISGQSNAEFFSFISRNDLDLSKKAINIRLIDKNDTNKNINEDYNNIIMNETKEGLIRDYKINKINELVSSSSKRFI